MTLHPVMMARVNNDPARFPQKQMNQCINILETDIRRCKHATVVYMKLPVHKSEPVSVIIVKPYGNTSAPILSTC
jgi:hypothetical protein